jgi:hypothetical protein
MGFCFTFSAMKSDSRLYILEFVVHVLFHFLDDCPNGFPEQGACQSKVKTFKGSRLVCAMNPVFGFGLVGERTVRLILLK